MPTSRLSAENSGVNISVCVRDKEDGKLGLSSKTKGFAPFLAGHFL
jgi:hypothetical protein